MKILITGARGFIGKNLILELQNRGFGDLLFCDADTTAEQLSAYAASCDAAVHLAGVNRPEREEEFMEGNFGFTESLLNALKAHNNKARIICTSSVQALRDNPYGKSKLAGEELLLDYERETGAEVFIFRLTNVFGKWCRPNYNSVVATFCNNIARGLPIEIHDESAGLNLIYIDDVVDALIGVVMGNAPASATDGRYYVHAVHQTTLGELAGRLRSFYNSRVNLQVPDMADAFSRKLYSTYLSYLPEDSFAYGLNTHADDRGSFTEILKQQAFGQVSVNVSRPEIIKGNHWHHTKNEKFLVVSGQGVIRFRKMDPFEEGEILEYKVSGEDLKVVDIPPGYVHSIENAGECDLITLMWANESYDSEKPDTYHNEV